ncbi:mechanosensitive ion channel family protein [Solibacillus daqui]|uniref:mechanosensitive ion channel family protein n=1 Tax=Solibacillus daqui TaxID=2912187 RepID=UPI00236502A0|nr:mechanosensitive ion channel family protein [Solibacillus daqui]
MKILWDSIKWLIPNVKPPTWSDGITALVLVIVGVLFIQFIFRPIIFKFARMLEERGHPVMSDIAKNIFPSMRNALIFMVLVLACSLLVEVNLFDHVKLRRFIDSVYIYFAFKALYDVLGFYLKNPGRFETGKDQDLLTPFFLRMSKVIVMVLAMFTIASLWNFNLNGFLTAIGLTGVALAFGIRDILAHIFSGMSVVLDKPFQIGDWVMTGDEKIDGTIEDINLRSTLIQTSDKGLVYVPNSYLVNRPIYNLSKRTQRKVEHYLFLSTENNEAEIVQFVETLREQIALHPKTLKTVIHVAVDEIRPSAYRVLIRYFVATNDTQVMLQVRQDILLVAKHYCEKYEIVQVDPVQAQFVWND